MHACSDDPNERVRFAYALCVLVNTGFVLFYVVHGTFRERPSEIFAFLLASFLTAAYLVYGFLRSSSDRRESLVRLVIGVALQPINLIFGG